MMKGLMRLILLSLWLSASGFAFAQNAGDTPQEYAGETVSATEKTIWKTCNETSFILRLAMAKTSGDKTNVTGWKRLRPSECLAEEIDQKSSRFLFAESAAVHNGGIREWAGDVPICVNPRDNFNVDINVTCALQGLESRRFLRIAFNDMETMLIEPDDFKTKAQTAGLQRLLKDAGYKISRIDGIDGRRTRNTLRAFLKEYEIDTGLSIFEKMDALEDAALSKQDITGLTLCNKTDTITWTAIGYREDGAWQSRGWWTIAPNDCIRPWSKDLTGTEMHVYAYKISEAGENLKFKNPLAAENNFCIAEAKFSSLGREFCTDKGYIPANFRSIPTIEKGFQLNLFDNDFTALPRNGLRE